MLRRFACRPPPFRTVWGGQTERETPLCNLKLYAACFGVCVGLAALVGVLLGLLSAFLGIGGGPINLVVLYYFFSMDSKTAALHSLYIIFFSQTASLISTFAKDNVPPVEPAVLIAMVIGGIAVGLLGSRISRRLDNAAVDRVFRVLLIVITLISCYNLWHYAALAF